MKDSKVHSESSRYNASNSKTTYYNTFKKRKNNRFYIFKPFTFQQRESFLAMDYHSKRNLELISSIRSGDQKGTLLWLLDETVTAMGGRKLKQWIHQPLANKQSIEARQEIVTSF